LRVKGAALKTSLFNLVNGYVTMEGTVKVRQGTVRSYAVDDTTKGLAVYKGQFYVFANATVSTPSGVVLRILINPNDSTQAVEKVWFAKPFLGFLYVAAEFANGDVFHYWLQSGGAWTADTVYFNGDIVVPTTGEVLAYLAQRLLPPNSVWSPQTTITEGQLIEPTVYNGYYFEATEVTGASPHTGSVEPTWPTTPNLTIQEFGDFGTTSGASSDTSISTATALPPSITNRYGNSAVIAGQTGTATATSGSPGSSVEAVGALTVWQAGTLYVPGAVVQPSTGQGAFIDAIPNGDFEAGTSGWTFDTPWAISSSGPFQGSQCAEYTSSSPFTADLIMADPGTVTPGQSVTATAQIQGDSDSTVTLGLKFYDSGDTLISTVYGTSNGGLNIAPHYAAATVTATAPATAAGVRVVLTAATGSNSARSGRADLVSWNLETPAAVSNFIYEAIQDTAATSASTEPTWPTTEGDTVVDGGVTWQAVGSSIITWTAHPIMESGDTEPTWPTIVGTTVSDGTMAWIATDRRITDPNCPHTKVVCIGASHVFCGDDDIVAYSAAVDPTDWSSSNNAGYLPTGLNDYGDNPVASLCLYRSNLVVSNAGGYQMWQIDPDPTNMSVLDGEPVPCTQTRSGQPANDDLVFLSPVGIRSIGTAGAAGNLQAGNFGKQVDAVVKELLAQLPSGVDPLGMFYPGTGQYLLFFGSKALVLTINGSTTQMSWSQYYLPYVVTDWAILDGDLYIRTTDPTAGDLILKFDEDTLTDDWQGDSEYVEFTGTMWYQYLDLGPIGLEKMMEGFDLAIDGTMTLSVGYNQKDTTQVTDGYAIDGDTMDEVGCVPFPVSGVSFQVRLEIDANQAWEVQMLNVYVVPESMT
jgi:hypothetical protein